MTKARKADTYRAARRNEAHQIRRSTKVREKDGRERRMSFPEAWILAQRNHQGKMNKRELDKRERKD